MSRDYRPEVDGLRAIAVLSVVIFHVFPAVLPGGFIGVDIFFVISGYLITRHLLSDFKKDIFSISKFYERRIRRIFPALIIILIVIYIYGFTSAVADSFKQMAKHIIGGVTFSSNILLMFENGYFDSSAELKPLLHLWSLGIEEQFYIFWPLLLYGAYRLKLVFGVLVFSILISLGLSIFYTKIDPVFSFYSPLTRGWQLLLGALIAYASSEKNLIITKKSSAFLIDLSGIILIAISLVGFSGGISYPGYWALIPTIGASFLMLPKVGNFISSIMAARLMVFFGLISYPLYLWHWLILTIYRLESNSEPDIYYGSVIIAFSILCAFATFYIVERAVRLKGKVSTLSLLTLMIFVGLLGLNAFSRDGITSRHKYLFGGLSSNIEDKVKEQRRHTCFLMDEKDSPDYFNSECVNNSSQFKIVLWGDSHAAAIYPGFRELEKFDRISLSQFNIAGCGGVIDETASKHCIAGNVAAINLIYKIKPDLLVIHKKWNFNELDLYESTFKQLLNNNIKILVIGPTPRWSPDLYSHVLKYWKVNKSFPPYYWTVGLNDEVNVALDEYFARRVKMMNIDYYSPYMLLCPGYEGCLTRIPDSGNSLTVHDGTHITAAAAKFIVDDLFKSELEVLVNKSIIKARKRIID